MDPQTKKNIITVLFNKYSKNDIFYGMKDANDRLCWEVNSSCLIYSRSNNKWFTGKINNIIFKNTNTGINEEWLIVKYNNKCKHMQRFCIDIKPIHSQYNDNNVKQVVEFIGKSFTKKCDKSLTAKRCFYRWKIPLLPTDKKYLLCCGYSRLNFDIFITDVIMQLFCQYFASELDNIQSAPADKKIPFMSDIFTKNTFRWQLQLYPNGCCSYTPHENQFVVFIYFYSVRFKISEVRTDIRLKICEIDEQFSDKHEFYHNDTQFENFIYCRYRIPFVNIQLNDIQDLNQLTIEFTVDILDVYDKDYDAISGCFGDLSYISTPCITLPVTTYQWKISDPMIIQEIKNTQHRKHYASPQYQWGVFKIIIYLTINDKDNMSSVHIDISDFPEEVDMIRFDYTLDLEEIKTDTDTDADTDPQRDMAMLHKEIESTQNQRIEILTERFQNVDNITVNFSFRMIDVYDRLNVIQNYVEDEIERNGNY